MKKLAFGVIAVCTIVASGSALAAPQDASIIAAQKMQAATPATSTAPATDAVAATEAAPVVRKYPLDHGPRATVTPWVNQQRRLQDQQDALLAAAHHDSDKHASSN